MRDGGALETAVGIYPASERGLYDLSGNVWEWCRNKYRQSEEDQVDNSNEGRVLRGGSWYDVSNGARAAFRSFFTPGFRFDNYGFRLVVVRRSPSHHPDR